MVNGKYIVLVNGMGNIGTTLINLLLHYKTSLKIDIIYVAKRTFNAWNKIECDFLIEKGAIICSTEPENGYPHLADVLPKVDYIFEATSNGVGLKHKPTYQDLPNLIGCSAQGSEKHFGIPFMSGVNDNVIKGEKFVNIVSCNTHGTAAILKTFCGDDLENLKQADVVVVRRSEDLGNHERLVSANVLARHLDASIGTHHAIDVADLFASRNCQVQLTSSDITTPSQLMHAVRFNIHLNHKNTKSVDELIAQNPMVAKTVKFDSNVIFELGRRYGFQGRLFSHAIINSENLLIEDKCIKGWAFVPQEGNSILSTLHAYLLQLDFPTAEAVFSQLKQDLLKPAW